MIFHDYVTVYQRVYLIFLATCRVLVISICLKVMNQFPKPHGTQDNFTTPRAVVSLRFFNCFRLLLEKAEMKKSHAEDIVILSNFL